MHDNDKPITPLAEVSAEVDALMQALAAPFDPREVKFKPAVVNGHRAMAMAYIDARVIQDRLDEVLGVLGWQDDYECRPEGSVICRLRLRIGNRWITKVDVGGPSEQPDGGDRLKAAFSDALKRAAVKFGVGPAAEVAARAGRGAQAQAGGARGRGQGGGVAGQRHRAAPAADEV